MHIGSVAVVVSNANEAAKWYSEKLGFEIVSGEGHWVAVAPKGSSVVIHLCQSRTGELEPGNTGIGLYAENIDETYEELKKKGVEFTRELQRVPGKPTSAWLKDPDGNELWLLEAKKP